MTAPLDLPRLTALAAAATPGPWKVQAGKYTGDDWLIASLGLDTPSNLDQFITTHNLRSSDMDGDGAAADAAFIAAAREAVPALVAEVERIRDAASEAVAVLDQEYADSDDLLRALERLRTALAQPGGGK